jgi:methionine synthase II (cobalamin-independent)
MVIPAGYILAAAIIKFATEALFENFKIGDDRLSGREYFFDHFTAPDAHFFWCCRRATDLVEHPELVADRLITLAEVVGQENVIAGTDCGFGSRVHPQIAWAKLRDRAAIASKKLWS